MRALLLLPLLAACASLPADNGSADRELAEILKDRTAGAAQTCVERSRVDGPQVIDGRTLVYRQSGQRVWVNRLRDSCPGLRTDSILIVRMFGTQMCDGDLFQTTQPGGIIPGPVCRLGKFTPYDRVTG